MPVIISSEDVFGEVMSTIADGPLHSMSFMTR